MLGIFSKLMSQNRSTDMVALPEALPPDEINVTLTLALYRAGLLATEREVGIDKEY